MNTAGELELLKGKLTIEALETKAKQLAVGTLHYNTSNVYDFKDGSLVKFITLNSFDIGRIMQVQDNRI